MSFIFDALKKSQSTRQQQAGPGTIAVETARSAPQPHNWWAMVIAIVVLNLIVVAGFAWWVVREQATMTTVPATQVAAAEPRAAVDEQLVAPTENAQQSAQPPIPVATERGAVRPLSAEVKTPIKQPPPPASAEQQAPPPEESPVILPSPSEAAGFLPTLAELTLDKRIQLSPLHVDVHVFNENPQRRFVLINARKYKEGERLSEGPLLEEIRRDGLVMYYRGQRFLVPRD